MASDATDRRASRAPSGSGGEAAPDAARLKRPVKGILIGQVFRLRATR